MKNLLLSVLSTLILFCASFAHANGDRQTEISNLHNSIVIEESTSSPLILARSIIFDRKWILIDPLISDPNYIMYAYDQRLPNIYMVDNNGRINQIIVSPDNIRVGDSIYQVPTKIDAAQSILTN